MVSIRQKGKSMQASPDSLKFPWYLIALFLILSIGILATGYLYYQYQGGYIKKQKQQELSAILALKIDQIISWRQEKLDYAYTIMADPYFAMQVRDFMRGRIKPLQRQYLLERLEALTSYQYKNLMLIDPQGKVRLAVPTVKAQEITPYLKSLALQAARTHRIIFSNLYRTKQAKVMLSVLTPLVVIQGENKITVGVVAMQIEPYQFLYPLIQSWPTPSRTGETELVQKEGSRVVFLNELRHRQHAPFNLYLPLNSPHVLAAMAGRGQKGIVAGIDYRNIRVIGAIGSIPDSPWLLIVKVDAAEIYAPLRKRFREILVLLIILIVSSGIGIAYLWRNQQTRFYRRQYEAESERRALAQRYEYLTRHANDIILVTDENLKIVEANDKAVAAYGYTRDELLELYLIDLYPPVVKKIFYRLMQQADQDSGLLFQAVQQRRDGTTFPVEISLRYLEIEGQKLFQEIIRDITERRQLEEALQDSERNLRQLTAELLSVHEDERKRISRELHDELGQLLLTLKLKIFGIKKSLPHGLEKVRKECSEAAGYLKTVVESVRRLSRNLSPSILEDLGLSVALRHQIDEFIEHRHIQGDIEVDEIDDLFPKESHINIYRVVQESLTNIGKHAEASRLTVKIKKQENEVAFLIEDNGRGFDVAQALNNEHERGLGLRTMQERLRMLGGSLNIGSQQGRGTRLSFAIPVGVVQGTSEDGGTSIVPG
jgi:PAS domain S-box-containing protein